MISAATYFERSETIPQSRLTPSQLSYRGAKKQTNEIAPTVCKMRITWIPLLTNHAFGTKIENDSQIQFAAEYFFYFLPKLKEVFFFGL